MGSTNKPAVRVRIEVHPGPASPAQQAAWRRFWAKLIADANHYQIENQTDDAVKEVNGEKNR